MDSPLPQAPRKGRGAVSNAAGRYERQRPEAFDDGWGSADPAAEERPLRTTVGCDASRKVITRNDSPDIHFDRSINAYRGCEHGCVYCFARPTHAWLGLSPGLDFETKLFAKPEAARLLEGELAAKSYRPAPIAMGTNTDPYQPIERRLEITRQILQVLERTHHPVTIVTKSNLVVRDLDILAPMAARGLAWVKISVTTLDRDLARSLEPRAPTPALRLQAIRELNAAGVPCGVMAAPMIPALNDMELEAILEAAAKAGAESANYSFLRLPLEIKDLFEEWLEAHAPGRKARVLKLIREARGGKLNDAAFGRRMKGRGAYAELLGQRFRLACKRLGLDRGEGDLDSSQFQPPPANPDQLTLL